MPFKSVTKQYLVALGMATKTQCFGHVTEQDSVFMKQNVSGSTHRSDLFKGHSLEPQP